MTSASLEAEREAAMKQATSASRAAETLMDAGAAGGDGQAVKELEQKLKTASAGKLVSWCTVRASERAPLSLYISCVMQLDIINSKPTETD
jgi:hypothetical protein